MYVIQVANGIDVSYIAGYSNTLAMPQFCLFSDAERFHTENDAYNWARKYLCAYNYVVLPI